MKLTDLLVRMLVLVEFTGERKYASYRDGSTDSLPTPRQRYL